MRSIVKRVCIVLIAALFFASAVGAKPKLISEAEAKKAGLAFINLTFGVSETDASVTYYEEGRYLYAHGERTKEDSVNGPIRIYRVAVSNPLVPKEDRYLADVNAVTGVAFRAIRLPETLSELSVEQQTRVSELGAWNETTEKAIRKDLAADGQNAAQVYVEQTFHPDHPVLDVTQREFYSDATQFPRVDLDYYVIIEDGTIYAVQLSWPTLEPQEIQIMNQREKLGAER